MQHVFLQYETVSAFLLPSIRCMEDEQAKSTCDTKPSVGDIMSWPADARPATMRPTIRSARASVLSLFILYTTVTRKAQ